MSRQYLSAGSIVEEVLKGRSLKAYCASKENLGKVDYALALETVKYKDTIVQLLSSCRVNATTMDVREGVLLVMIYELLFGAGKIQGGGSVKRKVLEHIDSLKEALAAMMDGKADHTELLPQSVLDHAKVGAFLRVNTAKIGVDDGFEHVTNMCKGAKFDTEIPSLIALPPRSSSLGQDEWVKSGKLIIQDKASCFPSQILHDAWLTIPDHAGTDFVDACAAPGNKTSHLAMLAMSTAAGKVSKVLAFEKNPRRAQLLRERMTLMSVDHVVRVDNSDFLNVNITDPKYAKVTAVLLDPSCSGSGVVKSLERAVEAAEHEESDSRSVRLASLQAFQIQVILKAMTFPRVQRIVYSTCSVHKEENEVVVAEILKQVGVAVANPVPSKKKTSSAGTSDAAVEASGWRVVAPPRFKNWQRRGLPLTEEDGAGATLTAVQSAALIRCAPEDGTNGFFVSLFERVGPLPPLPVYVPTPVPAAQSEHRKNHAENFTDGSSDKPQGRKQKRQLEDSADWPVAKKSAGDSKTDQDKTGAAEPPRAVKEKVVKDRGFLGKFKVQKRRK